MACSISPRLWVKASCWASSIFWSRNTSTAYLSMPAWIAATSSGVSGLPHVDALDLAREAGPDLADGDGHGCSPFDSLGMPACGERSVDANYRSGENLAGTAKVFSCLCRTTLSCRGGGQLAGLHRRARRRLALAHVLVGPDMDPLVERADVGEAGEDQRRDGGARLDARRPGLDHLGDGARPVGIGAELVDAAMLARLEMRREGRGMEDLALHLEDEVGDLGRPDARSATASARIWSRSLRSL